MPTPTTLPAGWENCGGIQRYHAGPFRVVVSTYQPGPFVWFIRTGEDEVASGREPTVPESRRAALDSLIALLTTTLTAARERRAELDPKD